MTALIDFATTYLIYLLAGLLLVDIVLLGLFFVINAKIRSIFKKGPVDVGEVLAGLQNHKDISEKEIATLKNRLGAVEQELPHDIRRVGLVRYNPFSDSGGDQSFALALLDEHKNGVVISSLYGREMNRVYAKRIESGASKQHTLTAEEERAIAEATQS